MAQVAPSLSSSMGVTLAASGKGGDRFGTDQLSRFLGLGRGLGRRGGGGFYQPFPLEIFRLFKIFFFF